MTLQELEAAFDAVCELPEPVQAFCVAQAAARVSHLWAERCERDGVADPAPDMLVRFGEWMQGSCGDTDLDGYGQQLQELVPEDIAVDSDPPSAYAGWALRDVPLVALGQGEDLQDDIVVTAVLYAAAAACRRGSDAAAARLDRVSTPELAFLDEWWRECRTRVPQLQ